MYFQGFSLSVRQEGCDRGKQVSGIEQKNKLKKNPSPQKYSVLTIVE